MLKLSLLVLLATGSVFGGGVPAEASEDGPKIFIRPNPTVRPDPQPTRPYPGRVNTRPAQGYFTITNNTDVDLYFDVNGRGERFQDEYLYPGETREYFGISSANIVFDYDLNRSGIQQDRQRVYKGESFVFELDRSNYLRLVEDYSFSNREVRGRRGGICHEESGLCLSF